MGDLLQPWHLIVLAVVAFLLFGAKRLPELGKGLGEGLKGFKEGLKGVSELGFDDDRAEHPASAAELHPRRPEVALGETRRETSRKRLTVRILRQRRPGS